ncbi:hypothetical protein RHGRI_002365 [Rhododendron griersonianum]|uniref:Photosystem II cytochrome b559 N-terminal domain-containing protein n=1 Tax=Rhododendron griersonianum TaxID=479676 RepID=A0AAV6LP90_9ERIC|nr:hypothetical protein RHGRI_002365 [Rhododendron griersonianum]
MTIDRTYPIFIVRWLAVHGLVVPTVSFLGSQEHHYTVSLFPSSNHQICYRRRSYFFSGLFFVFFLFFCILIWSNFVFSCYIRTF